MITTNNEAGFIELLNGLDQTKRKLILGKSSGNNIYAQFELRNMATAGGSQFAMAEINFMNQRASGRYTTDVEEAFIHACTAEDTHTDCKWFTVEDSEHTINSIY